jgi:exopolysaccharide biosynthesis polyprenyl glycosylphosphotransferase
MKKSAIIFGILTILFDFCGTVFAFLLARAVRERTDLIPGVQLPIGTIPDLPSYIPFVFGVSLFLIAIFAFNGVYSFKVRQTIQKEFLQILFLSVVWIMLVIAYFFIIHEYFFSRLVLIYSWLLTVLFISIGRWMIRIAQAILVRYNIGVSNILFIGTGTVVADMIARFEHDRFYHVVGLLSDQEKDMGHPKFLGKVEWLEAVCRKYHVDEILQTSSKVSDTYSSSETLEFCKLNHIRYRFIPDLLEVQRTNVEISDDEGLPVIELKPTPLDGWGRVFKRIFDLVVTIIGLIILSPVFLLIALCIKIDSPGPVFFIQKRVGYRGQEFWFFKFRSMYKDADKMKKQLLAQSERKGPLFKMKNDPRITRVGKFLRRTSLDELPQLFNVLIGNMSLVGPRPHLPSEVAEYQKHHHLLFTIKPGITGMAQVNGRSGLDFEDEVRFDLSYIQNWSLFLDIYIILKTIVVILRREHAD